MKPSRFFIVVLFFSFLSGVFAQGITYTSTQTGPHTYNWKLTRGATGTIPSLPAIINASDSVIVNINLCNAAETNANGACITDTPRDFTNCMTENLAAINYGTIWIKSTGFIYLNTSLTLSSGSKLKVDAGGKIYINGSLLTYGIFGGLPAAVIHNTGRIDVNGSINNAGNFVGGGLIRCCGSIMNTGSVYGNTASTIACNNAGLPVELIGMKAVKNGSDVEVIWSTGSEKDNNYFTIYRSYDGAVYHAIGTVKGMGTTNSTNRYSFIDDDIHGDQIYYQLTQTDINETTRYIGLTFIEVNGSELVVYPNPSEGIVTIRGYSSGKEERLFRIKDASGRIVTETKISEGESGFSTVIDLSAYQGLLTVEEISSQDVEVHKIMIY